MLLLEGESEGGEEERGGWVSSFERALRGGFGLFGVGGLGLRMRVSGGVV